MKGRKDCLVHLDNDVEYTSPDGVFMKGMLIPTKGVEVHQHSHEYPHTSLLTQGRVRVYEEGDSLGLEYEAPAFIHIAARVKHRFEALEDNTHVYCIHNLEGAIKGKDGRPLVHERNDGGV